MSLTATDKDQLAAPRRLEELPPPPFDFAGAPSGPTEQAELPVVDVIPDNLEAAEPSFLTHARALADSASESPMAKSRLAQAVMAVGLNEEASQLAMDSLELSKRTPDDAAVFSAARILMANGLFEEAEHALEALSPAGPITVLYATIAAQRGDLDSAFSRLADEPSVDAWDLRGWIALQNHHFDQAIRFLRRAMRDAGPSPALLTNLAVAHAALGAPTKAISETRQALALGPLQRHRVVYNLVAFLFSIGASDEGLHELRNLQRRFPHDIEPVFAEAHWALAVGDSERAAQRLRHARTSLWGHATEIQQAELLANQAYLRHYNGELDSDTAAREVIGQMRKTDWKSTRVVSMLPVLLHRYSDLPKFESVRRELLKAHSRQTFFALNFHRAVLRDELDQATQEALKWEKAAPFAPEAAASALFVLSQVEDRFEDAVAIGMKALKRMPAAVVVANNTAYGLALMGNPDQAKRLLLPEDQGSLYHIATQGLICAVKGDTPEASRLYDRAEEIAEREGSPYSSLLVNLHRRLIAVVTTRVDPGVWIKDVTLPRDWDDHPSLIQCLRMLRRRGAPLSDLETEDGAGLPEEIVPRPQTAS